jgi:hypothetical protein
MLTVLEIKKSIKKKNSFLHGGSFFWLSGPFFGLAVNCHSSNRPGGKALYNCLQLQLGQYKTGLINRDLFDNAVPVSPT